MYAALRTKQGSRPGGIALHLVVLGAFVALSAVMTFPLVAGLGDHVLGAPMPGDSFYYLFLLRWFREAVFGGRALSQLFFNPNMFYPFGYNLALSETTLCNAIPALPLTILFGEVVAYNLVVLLSFALSGFGTYLLVLNHTHSYLGAFLSGLCFAFCPYRLSHLGAGHLPLMGTQWLPFLLLYLDKTIVERRLSKAAMAALFYALGALSSWYYAYMFGLATVIYVLVRGRPWRQYLWQQQFARCVLTFVLVGLVLVGPLVLPVTRVWKEGGRPQSLRYLDQFSASPLDFFYPNVMQPLWGAWLLERYAQNINENALYLGLVPLVLAVIALWRQDGRTRRAFAWLSLIFAVMALGTTLHWDNAPVYIAVPGWLERIFTTGVGFLTKRLALYPISSYSLRVAGAIYLPLPTLLLYLYLPFFSAMRVWARLGLITVFGVSVLAGYGLQRLHKRCNWQGISARFRARGLVVTIAVFCLVILEFAAFPYALGTCSVQARPVDYWLAGQDGDFAIMEFPITKAMTGRSLYMMRTHGKKISFGYGTFFPRAFNEQREVLESFPDKESIALLKTWGVRYVLVGARSYGAAWPQLEKDLSAASGLRHALTLDDLPIYVGDRLLHFLPGTERAFIVDRTYVYEVL